MFYKQEELDKMGFKFLGENVLISNKTSIYGAQNIEIGSNVRIDDFCVISSGECGIKIGNNVHIAVFCCLIGNGLIIMDDFSGLSSRVSIYSSTDDYSGNYLTNPTISDEYKNVISGTVRLGKHVIIGSGSVILPNVNIDNYSSVGALSLVNKDVESSKIVAGIPSKIIKNRENKLSKLECEYLKK
jgi:acetyltransferase-like isoleucine patch superfamily enzyme